VKNTPDFKEWELKRYVTVGSVIDKLAKEAGITRDSARGVVQRAITNRRISIIQPAGRGGWRHVPRIEAEKFITRSAFIRVGIPAN